MLIYLEDDIASLNYENNPMLVDAIETLFQAVRRGEHFVHAKRTTFASLKSISSFGTRTRAMISAVEKDLAQNGSLANTITMMLSVSSHYSAIQKTGNRWNVPLSTLTTIRPAAILGENLDDTKIFFAAAKHYAISKKIGSSHIKLDGHSGGGSTTPQVFKNLLSQGIWCLAITDSDKKSPRGAPQTSLVGECTDIVSNSSRVTHYIALPSHEIENFVPNSIAIEAVKHCRDHPGENSLMDIVRKANSINLQNIYWHTDLKNGITLKNILSFPAGSEDAKFWGEIQADLVRNGSTNISCTNACQRTQNCKCHILEGLGDKLLSKIVNYFDSHSFHVSYNQIGACPWKNEWISIGEKVFEWGFARKQTLT